MWLICAAIYLIFSDIFFVISKDWQSIWGFSALIYQFFCFLFFLKGHLLYNCGKTLSTAFENQAGFGAFTAGASFSSLP